MPIMQYLSALIGRVTALLRGGPSRAQLAARLARLEEAHGGMPGARDEHEEMWDELDGLAIKLCKVKEREREVDLLVSVLCSLVKRYNGLPDEASPPPAGKPPGGGKHAGSAPRRLAAVPAPS